MATRRTIPEFEADLKAFGKGLRVKIATELRRDMYAFAKRIIELTPTLSERAAGSWAITLVPQRTSDLGPGEHEGAAAEAIRFAWETLLGTFANDYFNDRIFITNTVPYIRKLEFGGYPDGPNVINGHSHQAPFGMVRMAAAEFENKKRAIINVVRVG